MATEGASIKRSVHGFRCTTFTVYMNSTERPSLSLPRAINSSHDWCAFDLRPSFSRDILDVHLVGNLRLANAFRPHLKASSGSMFVAYPDKNIWDFNSYLVFTSIRKTPNSELSCVKLSGPPTGSELTIGSSGVCLPTIPQSCYGRQPAARIALQLPLADRMAASTNFERFPAGTASTISFAAKLKEKMRTTRVLPRRLPRLRPAPLRRPPLRPLIPAIFRTFFFW